MRFEGLVPLGTDNLGLLESAALQPHHHDGSSRGLRGFFFHFACHEAWRGKRSAGGR